MLDVVGAGFGRTGTLSLKMALERLGFGPCHHMIELFENPGLLPMWERAAEDGTADWDAIFDGYRATVDWPGARFWRQITGHFPAAKVILTVRDPRRWYESVAESIYKGVLMQPADPAIARQRALVRRLIWDGEFAGRFDDAEYAMGVFEAHNAAVRAAIPADRLLVMEVGEGWAPLCDFLGVAVPDEPFPHANDRKTFAEMVRQRLAEQ